MRGLAIALAMVGCSYQPPGKVSGQPTDDAQPDMPGDDSSTVVDTRPDVPPDPPSACVQKWLAGTMTFTTPDFLDKAGGGILANGDNERDPFVSSDELQIYFTRPGSGGDLDIVFSARATTNDLFPEPTRKDTLSDNSATENKLTMTGDDLTAIIASNRSGGEGGIDFWQQTRIAPGIQAFPTPLTQDFLGEVNDAGNQQDPYITADGLRLYFSNGSPQRLVVSSRATKTDNFAAPVEIANVADPGNGGDGDPTLSGDERVLLFASNRAGGQGGTDLWYGTRAERDQPFGTPINLTEINTLDNDGDPHLTSDGCRLYYSSTRDLGTLDFDVFFTKQDD